MEGQKKKLGFAEKEIEKVQSTKSQITWNNSRVRNWERQGSTETRMIFFLAQRKKKKKTNETAITNGPLCRQFHLHTVKLEANIAFCDTILVSWGWDCWSESPIWLWWRKLLNSSLGFLFSRIFPQGNIFFLFVKRDLKPSVTYWNGSMRVWPLCVLWWTANNSVPEERTWCKTTLASYTRPSGHRSEGFWTELSALFGFLEQHTHAQSHAMLMLGLVKLNISVSTPTQWALSRMQMPWLKWRVELFFFL